jgi:hypothetical protein
MTSMSIAIPIPQEQIAEFCQRHHIRRLALFGSVLRNDFGPDSDVDVLVEFESGVEPGLDELLAMEESLGRLMGRSVDLGERASVEADQNYIRRQDILRSAHVIYEK